MNTKKNNERGRLILWLGIAFGLILTAFLWLGTSEQIYISLRWTGYAGITVAGLTLFIRTSAPPRIHPAGFIRLGLDPLPVSCIAWTGL